MAMQQNLQAFDLCNAGGQGAHTLNRPASCLLWEVQIALS